MSFLKSSIPRNYKKDYSYNQRKFAKILTCTALLFTINRKVCSSKTIMSVTSILHCFTRPTSDFPLCSLCCWRWRIYTYASAVLNAGLLLLEFKYAIRVEYRLMILRCWKALLLHFHSANHYNCAKEAVRMIATVNALATPLVAAQITWSWVESGVNIS